MTRAEEIECLMELLLLTKKEVPEELKKLFLTRSECREILMGLIFQLDNQGELIDIEETLKVMHIENSNSKYITRVFTLIKENLENIDNLINETSGSWKTNRIAKVDLAILRLAVGELMYEKDTPKGVVANEATNIAKKYGTDESSKFINGIVGTIIRNMQNEEK